jgi:cell division inhibitor SepF
MSGFWARTLVYLGLREEPEDHVVWDVLESADAGDVVPAAAASRAAAPRPSARPVEDRVAPAPVARAVPREPVADVRPLRGVPAPDDATAEGVEGRVAVVQLRVFDDVEAAARGHRDGLPVLLDVSGAAAPDDRRAIDFLSGVVYASGGTLRRLTRGAFLMLPHGVQLDAAERGRLERLGYPVDGGGAR